MKTRNIMGLLVSLTALVMAGCGGGGGGGSTASGSTVSGVASKGPIKGGHYQAFQIFSSHDPAKSRPSDTPFFSGVTDDKGNYSVPIPADIKKDGIYIKIVDGTYQDEATQTEKHVEVEYPNGMRAAFGNISGVVKRGEHLKVYVTPYTEMAFRSATVKLDDNSVHIGQHEIEHAFGLDDKGVDIIHTQPLDPSVAPPAGADDHQKAYTNALGIISQYEKDNLATHDKLDDFGTDLIAEIHNNGGLLTQTTKSGLDSSELTFDNSGHDNTGVTPGGVTVTVAASKPTASIGNDPVTISATVKVGGVAVPNTEVKFTVKSGAGSLSEKSFLTNASGVASTTLTSAVNGDVVVVTATAGGISSDSDSVNFSNPNGALSVALVSSPASGTTLANGGVTLTATVSPVSSSGTIADGTVVTFLITSGTGTLSAVTTTTGGVATATLSATTANTVSVTAKAGTATSAALSVNFISQPTKAIIKLSTAGVPSGTMIGGLNVKVTLPAGVTLQKNPDNSTANGVVQTTGVAAASGALSIGNAATAGSVTIGMITTSGFGGGEFVTINADVASGTFPTPADFTLALVGNVITPTSVTIPNVALSAALTLQ